MLSRSGPTQTREQFRLGDAGRQEFRLLRPLAAQTAERVHQDRRGQPHRRPLRGLGRDFLRAPLVDPPSPGVGPDQVVLQHGLEVGLLADLLEEGQPHLGVVHRHVARPQDRPALPLAVAGSEARGQEPKRTARALEVGDGRPAFAHQVDERRMERVGSADAVPQREAFFLRLLLLGGRAA